MWQLNQPILQVITDYLPVTRINLHQWVIHRKLTTIHSHVLLKPEESLDIFFHWSIFHTEDSSLVWQKPPIDIFSLNFVRENPPTCLLDEDKES